MIIFLLTVFLPLLEIAGFVVIGGEIGLGWSLLWVIGATMAGFYFMATMGAQTLHKAKKSVAADVYPFEEMFDGICILVGALLLIFPGFFSDFLALPLLVAPVRRGIFRFLKYQHESFFNDLGKSAQGFSYWYYEEKNSPPATVVEGEFKRVEEEKTLPDK